MQSRLRLDWKFDIEIYLADIIGVPYRIRTGVAAVREAL